MLLRDTFRPSDRAARSVGQQCAYPLLLVLLVAAAPRAQSAELAARARLAAQAMNDQRFDDASVIYRRILEDRPDDPEILVALGTALARGRRHQEALAPLERAVALKEDLLAAHALLGAAYLALGNHGSAAGPLERVVAARPQDVASRRILAQAYGGSGRPLRRLAELRKITTLAPAAPSGWYELGQAYTDLAQDAAATFASEPEGSAWRRLLTADALLARGLMTDAFALYRETLEHLPAMVSIHDSVAQIYRQTGNGVWATRESAKGALAPAFCAKRTAICDFRAGRYQAALDAVVTDSDLEARYWRVRAATALALAAFAQLDGLADSAERRAIRATRARAQERFTDAVAELKVALALAPGVPALVYELASAYHAARAYEQAVSTLSPLLESRPDDARLLRLAADSWLELRRPDQAIPLLRRAVEWDVTARLALGRAYFHNGEFAAAIPLLETNLGGDQDGSVHVQLARAYIAVGRRPEAAALLTRSEEIHRAVEAYREAAGRRTITPPK